MKKEKQLEFIDNNPHLQFIDDLRSLQTTISSAIEIATNDNADSLFVGDFLKIAQCRLTLLKKDFSRITPTPRVNPKYKQQ